MRHFKNKLDDYIWEDFRSLLENPLLLSSYINYFLILADWVKKYERNFKQATDWDRTRAVLDIDIHEYISPEPEISLDFEAKRIFEHRPKTVNCLLTTVCNTLWEMVRFRSRIDCPRCIDDELNYVVAEVLKTGEKKIVLECDTCGEALNIDGTEWTDGSADIYPANKAIVMAYLDAN